MSDENVREKLNDMDGTRPIKYKLCMKKDMHYKTTAKSEVVEDIDTFSQTLMRELLEFRAHCDRAFPQYEEIRHLRGKFKPMMEATCQVDYARNRQVDCASTMYVDEIGSVCYDKAQISIHPMVLHYRDEDGDMKVLRFVGLSGIMAHSVPSTFAFLKAMMLELHQTMLLLNTIHFVTDCPSSQYQNSSICGLVGQAQLIRTPNNEVKHPFVIWCTTCQPS